MILPSRAALIVVSVGCLWGLYWLPLRQIEAAAAMGTWATVIAVAVAVLGLMAVVGRRLMEPLSTAPLTLASTALGGVSFVFYSNGLLYGDVVVVILMFYTTPIWSALIGRLWLGWPISGPRVIAVGAGLAGIALVLAGSHGGLPLPRGLGDAFGLVSAVLWAIAATGIRTQARLPALQCNLVFCVGALVAALACALVLSPQTPPSRFGVEALGPALLWAVVLGGGWWAMALTLFLWSAQRLEPARVGILLMGEVVVGTVSGALLAGETVGAVVVLGSILVVGAGAIEAWTERDAPAT